MRIAQIILAIAALPLASRAEIANIVVTSAASFERGMPWGGSIASVFCTGLKGINGVIAADHYPLPLELAGVRVTIGETRAPLFAVVELGGYQQINLQVPWEAAGATNIDIQQGGERGGVVLPNVLAPGDFFRLADGSGAFQHSADYALVSARNPARAGEVVVGYLTGLLTRPVPSIPTGQPSPVGQPGWENTVLKPAFGVPRPVWEIAVGASPQISIAPLFLGLAPGLVGVYQVNFTVPEGLAAGNQPVRLIENTCDTAFGTCIVIHASGVSLPVPMAVQ